MTKLKTVYFRWKIFDDWINVYMLSWWFSDWSYPFLLPLRPLRSLVLITYVMKHSICFQVSSNSRIRGTIVSWVRLVLTAWHTILFAMLLLQPYFCFPVSTNARHQPRQVRFTLYGFGSSDLEVFDGTKPPIQLHSQIFNALAPLDFSSA